MLTPHFVDSFKSVSVPTNFLLDPVVQIGLPKHDRGLGQKALHAAIFACLIQLPLKATMGDCGSSSGSQAYIGLYAYSRTLKEADYEICRFLA